MKWVVRRWRQREKELADTRAAQKGAFDSYIADLMAPVLSASQQLHRQNNVRGRAARKAKWNMKNDERRVRRKCIANQNAELNEHSGHRKVQNGVTRWNDIRWGTQSSAEVDGAEMWRQQRKEVKQRPETDNNIIQAWANMHTTEADWI